MDFVKAIVAFDADLNVFNRDNRTPLDIAEAEKSEKIAQLLRDVGGLTGRSILDRSEELEGAEFVPEMNRDVMAMDEPPKIFKMDQSLFGVTGPMGGPNRHRAEISPNAGVSPNALATRLEGVAERDRGDVGYQRQADISSDSVYYSPPEERKMGAIAEGGWGGVVR